ncbi:DUF6716 putative glycosyltransferase [uncultured Roseovarius sp.]|uniref:DUF6716 putative glycosyltransferase n=1 Tax=uncultured Roseovarius sp. TaxID=293344 RepID=UPI0026138DEC|nr:DUF6716 putative glycosyltransferase [uncultured Roseovarius sp.]
MSRRPTRLLIPFCDDSTLIFAVRLRALLHEAAPSASVILGCYMPEEGLSRRQLEMFVPDGDYLLLTDEGLVQAVQDGQYDAVLTSRVFQPLRSLLTTPAFRHHRGRAQVIAFLGGLDFFPERGFANRMPCDGVFLFPQSDLKTFADYAAQQAAHDSSLGAPLVDFGHPTFLEPAPNPPGDLADRRDIYFFAQAISPLTRRGRVHVLNVMTALAEAYPHRDVWIKLRHLPDENQTHLHREKHDYARLMDSARQPWPANLKLTACSMQEAIERAALGITCTSTAAIDLIREGVPTMVYVDYVDAYMDPMAAAMRRIFAQSGVIVTLDDLLHLRHGTPDPDWLREMFCPRDLGQRVLAMLERLQPLASSASE